MFVITVYTTGCLLQNAILGKSIFYCILCVCINDPTLPTNVILFHKNKLLKVCLLVGRAGTHLTVQHLSVCQ